MKTTNLLPMSGLMFSLAFTAVAQEATEKKQPVAPEAAPASAATNEPVRRVNSDTEAGLRLNFRGVPLDMVLSYLSDAAGFIIVMEGEPRGKVDVWSNQPLTKDEAVSLLNTILNKNGYAAIRNGRTLKIVSRDEAKTKDIPVRSGSDPELIPKTEEMITQVIPVRYANASQLTKDLQPLMPTYAIMTANESGNALVITDTQTSVRRMVEIVKALDTSIASVSTIRVFPLRYADAKTLADAVKELFAPPTQQSNNNNDRRSRFFSQFGGGSPFGGGGPGGSSSSGSSGSSGGGANTKVVALADERANSLVVSAPDDTIPTIEKLVAEMDVSVTDVSELRVFRLRNADPAEMADLFTQLFPDETTQNRNGSSRENPFGFRFGGDGGGRSSRNSSQANSSERTKKMGQVKAVSDPRTSSLIISASTEMMPQIAQMVEQLDSDASRKQKVFVYSLENADVQQVEQIVRGMFERTTTTGNRNNQNQNSALNQRSQQNAQQQGQNTGGNSGFGGGGFGGGGATGR
jgi:general secretion pathway protein D